MWIEPADARPDFVRDIAGSLRAWDAREAFALRFDDDSEALAQAILQAGPVFWVAGLGAAPIAVFGCTEMWPGVWSMWLLATDDFHHIGISMTKLVTRDIVPMLFEAGAHRLEAKSMEGHDDAQRWLELIGARREATHPAFGRGRETFHTYVWSNS